MTASTSDEQRYDPVERALASLANRPVTQTEPQEPLVRPGSYMVMARAYAQQPPRFTDDERSA